MARRLPFSYNDGGEHPPRSFDECETCTAVGRDKRRHEGLFRIRLCSIRKAHGLSAGRAEIRALKLTGPLPSPPFVWAHRSQFGVTVPTLEQSTSEETADHSQTESPLFCDAACNLMIRLFSNIHLGISIICDWTMETRLHRLRHDSACMKGLSA